MQNLNNHSTRILRKSTFNFALTAALLAFALGNLAPVGTLTAAEEVKPKTECPEVGGAFVTNFIAPDQTAGTATGDLKGALGVKLLKSVGTIGAGTPVIITVQHFWVTETGDTILSQEAEVTAYPSTSPSQPLLYSFVYENGLKIIGGTGKFDGAGGRLKAWGAIDLDRGEVVGRYSGEICFKSLGKQ